MSDLLNSASLVMIPSGYKEDTVYSVVPSDGSGDLSFTRASNGTRVNSAGLVEVVPWNLVQYSEEFDNSFWTKNNCTVTANNTTAPNGTNTADLITSTSTNETGVYYFPAVIGTNTWSIYAKKGTGRYLFFNTNNPPNIAVKFDLEDGVIVGTPQTGATPSIENVGNGWYRCIITANTAENRFTAFITNNTTTDNLTSSVGLSYYLWGAQLNIGATAKPYFPTTDRLNVPRLTYQNGGGGCPSLLLEKQSTNLVLYSEQFDNAAWSANLNASVTANATTSPDGTQNADKIVEDTSNSQHFIGQTSTSINSVGHTISVYAKASERSFLFLFEDSAGGRNAYFDLANGTIGTIGGSATASITSVGNGWYRCSVTYTASGTLVRMRCAPAISNGTVSYTGNGTSGIFVWGAQCEVSSYPTSYIPTTSSSATRVADACFKTGINSLIGQTEGAFFVEFIFNSKQGMAIQIANSSSYADAIYLERNGDTSMVLNCYYGGVQQVGIQTNDLVDGQSYKVAVAYKSNDFAFYKNGLLVGSDSSANLPSSLNDLYVGGYGGAAGYEITIKQVALFKTRLTNTQLAQLTA